MIIRQNRIMYFLYKLKELELFIRNQLSEDDNFVQECNQCFDSAINLFKDLESYFTK